MANRAVEVRSTPRAIQRRSVSTALAMLHLLAAVRVVGLSQCSHPGPLRLVIDFWFRAQPCQQAKRVRRVCRLGGGVILVRQVAKRDRAGGTGFDTGGRVIVLVD